MNRRASVVVALSLAIVAVLACETLSYALVYPAQHSSKLGLALALGAGSLLAVLGSWLCLAALKRAPGHPDRFFALLGLALSLFFLFVMIAGFGIPELFLSAKD